MPTPTDVRIVVAKQTRQLNLIKGSQPQRSYAVTLGRNTGADKAVEGDQATPAGEFYICAKNPRSKYFLSLCISYPNAEHATRGLAAGLIDAEQHAQILQAVRERRMPPQHTRLGGEIYIHGCSEQHQPLGTRGCIALSNADMRDLYDQVMLGTEVTIEP
jgi:murein L,D-transpeptidase YafK